MDFDAATRIDPREPPPTRDVNMESNTSVNVMIPGSVVEPKGMTDHTYALPETHC